MDSILSLTGTPANATRKVISNVLHTMGRKENDAFRLKTVQDAFGTQLNPIRTRLRKMDRGYLLDHNEPRFQFEQYTAVGDIQTGILPKGGNDKEMAVFWKPRVIPVNS